MLPLDRFAMTVCGEDDELLRQLDVAALSLAAHARGDADGNAIDAGLHSLDVLAVGLEPTLAAIEERLFRDLGLMGDTVSYDAPENSYLDDVLARRRGLPITLSIIAISVGRRANVDMSPIAMPGHFLVRHEGEPRVLIDCFGGGRRLTSGDCEAIVHGVYGADTAFDLDWLKPVGPRPVLTRMLANLAGTASRRADRNLLARITELHAALQGRP